MAEVEDGVSRSSFDCKLSMSSVIEVELVVLGTIASSGDKKFASIPKLVLLLRESLPAVYYVYNSIVRVMIVCYI